MKWKVSDSDFRYIEDEVKLYPKYKEKIEELIQSYSYSTPERDSNGGGKSNSPGRPVENTVFNILDDLQLLRMRTYVKEVERAYNELDEEKKRVINAIFWRTGSKGATKICSEFSIGETTYWRWKKAFLLRVGLLTGHKRVG